MLGKRKQERIDPKAKARTRTDAHRTNQVKTHWRIDDKGNGDDHASFTSEDAVEISSIQSNHPGQRRVD